MFGRIRRKLAPARERRLGSIPLPSQEMQMGVGFATADEYLRVGRDLRQDIVARTGMGPTASVLDIGCGSGRLARHFAGHIRKPGRYVGMDIQKHFVDWCARSISPVNPVFEFYHQDIHNGHYNPEGKYKASEYKFPFDDRSFDLVILTSVFTHLLVEDTSNYLGEISRLLKPGGLCYSTWFLLGHDVEVKYLRPHVPEAQVGYGFRHLSGLLERHGLTPAREPALGNWRGGGAKIAQDVLVLGRSSDVKGGEPYPRPATARAADYQQAAEEVSGSIVSVDPVGHAVTLVVEQERRTFAIAEGAGIEANRRPADSSSLRRGQDVTLRAAGGHGDVPVAVSVSATDSPQADQIRGMIENVDLERGTVTLFSGGKYTTFEFDPAASVVRVNGELVEARELKAGQRAAVRYLPRVDAIGASEPDRRGG